MTTTIIDYSTIESETLGLKIGRCNHDCFNAAQFYQQITEGRYDLCRLKVPAEDEFAPHRLNQTGLPSFFSGSIRRYQTKITHAPDGEYNYPDLVWEYYDGTQNELLRDMLIGTWGNYPIGYYRSPYVRELVSKNMEIESVFRFYQKHNNPDNNPNNTIVFIKHHDNYVGFFALNKLNGNLESHVGGILEPFRKGGYFLDKLRYIKNYCIEHGLQHFVFGARNENAAVQRIFQYVGFLAIGSENVFHIPSLLTYSSSKPIEKTISTSKKNTYELYQLLFSEALSLSGLQSSAQSRIHLHLNHVAELLKEETVTIRFSIPVNTPGQLLIVLRNINPNYSLFSGYFSAQI